MFRKAMGEAIHEWGRYRACDDHIDLGETVVNLDLCVDNLGGGSSFRHVVLYDGGDFLRRIGLGKNGPSAELHGEHDDNRGYGGPAHASEDLRVALQRVATGHETCSAIPVSYTHLTL